jgi:hypothetical protein
LLLKLETCTRVKEVADNFFYSWSWRLGALGEVKKWQPIKIHVKVADW